jgi:hypothetical protein
LSRSSRSITRPSPLGVRHVLGLGVRLLRRKRVAQDRRIAPRARMRRPTGTHRRRARCRIGPEQPSARRPARDTRSASTSSRKADVDADVENPTQVLRSTGRRQPSQRRRRARFSPTGVTTSSAPTWSLVVQGRTLRARRSDELPRSHGTLGHCRFHPDQIGRRAAAFAWAGYPLRYPDLALALAIRRFLW